MVKNYKDLQVWQKSMNLVEAVYKLTSAFPKEELYGLSNQLRRAAVSVPSNIAEGSSRRSSKKEFIHFLNIAYGSLAEIETQLEIARRLNFISSSDTENCIKNIDEIMRMTTGLIQSLSKRDNVTQLSTLTTQLSSEGGN